ncbi:LLM class flavin-dependent oxidoreductase [Crossiella sp. SN42]|uniref:LLM class flavin-dependent oxidoreductase n=1 Tax=Crossiella sp. SN42 TaxID=2944808 RepID=UPI00207CBE87|nr:LLM class flavin-dependent oxidoreductase [Crossiella sp. SN42]MCO1582511.1 LLM class flavin-dependent oxidoreductase [Crossiella sp. SN42]
MPLSRSVPLSVLDLAIITNGSTATAALRETLDLATQTERLGYHRFWLAEHHNMPGVASSAPAVLIGQVAAVTSTMRVGSGGVMLPNHPPLVVAEQFGMLEALYPGRIDLGLGRAPGTDPRTAQALRRSASPLSADDFPEQLGELVRYFDEPVPGEPEPPVRAVPAAGNRPPVWLLGSSGYSARLAGMLGLPFAFAHHFSAENTLPALRLYRDNFRPSAELDRPYAMVCASVIAADTDEHARWLAGPGGLSFLRLRGGRPGLFPTAQEAADYPYSALEREFVEARFASQIIGGPETVAAGLEKLLAETMADELMVTSMVPGHAERLRSFELVAKIAA